MFRRSDFAAVAIIVMFVAGLVFAGCGGGSSKTSTPAAPATTSISTPTQGSQAASTGTQAGTMLSGTTSTVGTLGNIGLTSLVGAPKFKIPAGPVTDKGMLLAMKLSDKIGSSNAAKMAAGSFKKASGNINNQIQNCTGSGNISVGGTYNNDNIATNHIMSYSLTFTFAGCREGDSYLNGVFTIGGSVNNSTGYKSATQTIGTTGSPFTVGIYNASNVLISNMTTAISLGLEADAAGKVVMTTNGTLVASDLVENKTFDMTFSNLKDEYTTSGSTTTMKANGGFSETWNGGANGISITYYDMIVVMTDTASQWTMSVDGKYVIDLTPNSCFEGSFAFVTNTPVTFDKTSNHTTGGKMTINGNTVVEYASDGTSTVKVGSGAAVPVNPADLTACDFGTI